jgi:hypothetical protein
VIKTFFICCLSSMLLIAAGAVLFPSKWQPYFDQEVPQVEISRQQDRIPIGINGGKFRLSLRDDNPGLDEVIVRVRQLRADHVLFKKKLAGVKAVDLEIDIPSTKQDEDGRGVLGQGSGELEVVAFDRSYYSNRGIASAKIYVDSKLPKLEGLTSQHNLRQGGIQMVFYFAEDENLKLSGVRVGQKVYPGFKASLIDSSLAKPGLYVALYSVPILSKVKSADLVLFAEDVGGNRVEKGFYNKIAARKFRTLNSSNTRLLAWLDSFPLDQVDSEPAAKIEPSEAKSEIDAVKISQGFNKVEGTTLVTFGDILTSPKGKFVTDGFVFSGLSQAKALQLGEVYSISRYKNGMYSVVLRHALGITTEYHGLSSVLVQEGQSVEAGAQLGVVTDYLLIRTVLADQAVDPTELWSQSWITDHILDKISQAKRSLGIIEE